MLVVAGGATVDREQLAAICAGELADYKRPRYLVEQGAPLPRTLGGKVMKRELRERYRDLPPGVVDLKRPVC
jgi:fatty-acyl-CoA synthase